MAPTTTHPPTHPPGNHQAKACHGTSSRSLPELRRRVESSGPAPPRLEALGFGQKRLLRAALGVQIQHAAEPLGSAAPHPTEKLTRRKPTRPETSREDFRGGTRNGWIQPAWWTLNKGSFVWKRQTGMPRMCMSAS